MRAVGLAAMLGCLALASAGCATWQAPTDLGDDSLRARAVGQARDGIQVHATVLGPEDSLRYFGTDVLASGVQAVWIEVHNGGDQQLMLLHSGTDPDYFSPLEVAWSAHLKWRSRSNARIDAHFERMAFVNPVPPGETRAGMLYTNPQPNLKVVNVDLVGNRTMVPFTLFAPVPGESDHTLASVHEYPATEVTDYTDLAAFRTALERLDCCTIRANGTRPGVPLNAIFIGHIEDIAAAGARRGYRQAATKADLTEEVFGRPPDLVARKRDRDGVPSYWLRLWLAPLSFRGQQVYLVQTGRPVGGRFVDEDVPRPMHANVNEARNLLIGDMAYSGGLESLGFVGGAAPPAGSSLQSDGFRAVLFFTTRPRSFAQIDLLDWEPLLEERALEAMR